MRVYSDGEMEANEIAAEIAELVNSGKRKYSDFAVFYRVNALSRSVETALSRHQVPFQVASGFSFYERAEVRDLIGYLRLIENSSDDVAFVRIVNRPARGIGEKTVQRLTEYARQNGVSLLDAAAKAADIPSLTARSRKPLKAFSDLIHKLQKKAESGNVRKLLERLIDEIDYFKLWKDENDEVDTDRKANIYELLRAAELYEDAEHTPSLQGFLELAGLTSEADSVDEHKGVVTLMTMHAAKGLEFPVVFVLGVESGLIPHERAIRDGDPASFQEERRLLFVAVTRAMEELNLTQTRQRDFRGVRRYTIASPFVPEMEMEVVAEDDQPVPQMRQPSALDEFVIKAKQRYQAAQSVPTAPQIMSAADLEKKLAAMKAGSAADNAGGTIGGKGSEADRLRPASFVVESIEQMEAPATSVDADSLFAAGRPVRHPRYGRGVVLEASEGGSRATVTVLFEADDREETFVTAHCPLQPIGAG